jgi:hypothetical protein
MYDILPMCTGVMNNAMGGGAGRAQVILCCQEKGNKAHKNSLVGADEEEPELLKRERTAHTLCIGSVWCRETFQQLVQQLVSMAWHHIYLTGIDLFP